MKTIRELIDCAKREHAMRIRVYDKKIREGKMDALKAAHETECMAEIVKTLEGLEQATLAL